MRVTIQLFISLLIVGLLAGCGEGQENSNATAAAVVTATHTPAATATVPSPSPTATATSTSTPTATPSPTATTTPTLTPTPKPPTEEELSAALLTLDDFPSGWVVDQSDDESEREEEEESFTFLCESLPRRAAYSVTREFRKSEFGPLLGHSITLYPPGEAQIALDDFRETAEVCDEWETTLDDGTPTTVHIRPMSFTQMGDEVFALRMTMKDVPFFGVMEIDSVDIRRGDLIIQISHMVIGLEEVDSAQTEAFAKKALEKLDEVLEVAR